MAIIRQFSIIIIFLLGNMYVKAGVTSLAFTEDSIENKSFVACTIDSIVGDTNICANGSYSFTAFVNDPNASVHWYRDSIGGIPFFIGNPLASDSLTFAKIYVEAKDVSNQVCTTERTKLSLLIIPDGPLPLPTVSCTKETPEQVKVSWERIEGAGGYEVGYDNGSGGQVPFYPVPKGKLDTTISGLKPSWSGYISVRAIKANINCPNPNGLVHVYKCAIPGEKRDVPLPDAFSPNNDGENDDFGPESKGRSFVNHEMTIYDRYGGVVFETKLKNQKWNGKHNNTGIDLPTGVYIYHLVITGLDMTNDTKTFIGQVTLVR